MKLKYTYFETREQYDEAVASGEQVTWKVLDVDTASVEDFAEYMENILIDDSAPECAEDFVDILTYFSEMRESDMRALVTLAWKEYEHLYEKLCRFFHVYEFYHAEVAGELSDDEAVEAALNSPEGVRNVIWAKEPMDATLKLYVWQGKTGTTTTVDYYLEV